MGLCPALRTEPFEVIYYGCNLCCHLMELGAVTPFTDEHAEAQADSEM